MSRTLTIGDLPDLARGAAFLGTGGGGNPYVLAFTPEEPLWGHERWGFVVRASGPRLFLTDAMDRRCREGF